VIRLSDPLSSKPKSPPLMCSSFGCVHFSAPYVAAASSDSLMERRREVGSNRENRLLEELRAVLLPPLSIEEFRLLTESWEADLLPAPRAFRSMIDVSKAMPCAGE
jgi:hypothetical protein